jgi:hypothetical protein
MIIHWKGLEEHSLMIQLFFRTNHLPGKNHIFGFFSKKPVPNELTIQIMWADKNSPGNFFSK